MFCIKIGNVLIGNKYLVFLYVKYTDGPRHTFISVMPYSSNNVGEICVVI